MKKLMGLVAVVCVVIGISMCEAGERHRTRVGVYGSVRSHSHVVGRRVASCAAGASYRVRSSSRCPNGVCR